MARFDVCTPRKKSDGGTYWVKIGTAWTKDGKPPQIVFDALPIPDAEGRCVVNLFEPKERDSAPRNEQPRQQGGSNRFTDDEDTVPF